MEGVFKSISWIFRQDDSRTEKQKAIDLLLTGDPITSKQANKVLGWKFATRIGEAIKHLEKFGIKVEKRTYDKKFRIYQIVK